VHEDYGERSRTGPGLAGELVPYRSS
jgi:hypothetical protein